ncbi:MAG: arsenosugar biosynthesis radical SAM protein ArsS [Planctomycetaceae bacterium]|nr:arsenosugar biosynthesis radical SAM protein ArsS [Planctomycetaceae bacterium]
MTELTLLRRNHALATPGEQRRILERPENNLPFFDQFLQQQNIVPLTCDAVKTLQVNVGRVCNQTCRHCHVDAGPDRREQMSREVMEHCLRLLDGSRIEIVDITGGAPEMHPHFRWFVSEIRQRGCHVIDRCNLTILLAPGYTDLAEFLAGESVEVIASLPCYLEENCDRQRGDGVFQKSIEALQRLNQLGYATNPTRRLCLVYNPTGATLPPSQTGLEAAYRQQLRDRFSIEFNSLYAITNMPISRFLEDLLQSARYDAYLSLLVNSFNPAAVNGVMCRSMISVDWQGRLFDCDFNQMLDLPISSPHLQQISQVTANDLGNRLISVGRHCFGCTAGSGSSCSGVLIDQG